MIFFNGNSNFEPKFDPKYNKLKLFKYVYLDNSHFTSIVIANQLIISAVLSRLVISQFFLSRECIIYAAFWIEYDQVI